MEIQKTSDYIITFGKISIVSILMNFFMKINLSIVKNALVLIKLFYKTESSSKKKRNDFD
ncbi:hypothetical protein BC2903_38930 [Bacillus cereus]|nr:hypothetical protein C1640_29395 [Bacillus sp. AKBS9]GCF70074.1 hypothetical protein BC2903_38930 [Bacillus cereus]